MDVFLNILTNIIIQKYFQNSGCLLIFTDYGNSFQYSNDLPVVNILIENKDLHPEIFLHNFGCQGIIMKSNNPASSFKSFESQIKFSGERFNRRKYLIIQGNDMQENFTEILSSEEIMYVSDLVIVEKNADISKELAFFLWTHSYVGNDMRNQIVLDTWFSHNKSFLYQQDLYPNKLKNQMGRKIRMATFRYEPYSIVGKKCNMQMYIYCKKVFGSLFNAVKNQNLLNG